ncbi:uncharacterized protein G2W53_031305 [Senna tora]|uniref:Uncharacterized protein n=1 Tax=Senna tora TaxID=362788 RepID=A0A834TAF1_9FABA|nr:uncharacterized protein G2W53_031305 [Senna tora]
MEGQIKSIIMKVMREYPHVVILKAGRAQRVVS